MKTKTSILLFFVIAVGIMEVSAQTFYRTPSLSEYEDGKATYGYYIDSNSRVAYHRDFHFESNDGTLIVDGTFDMNRREGKWIFKIKDRYLIGNFSDDSLDGIWNYTELDQQRVISTIKFNKKPLKKGLSLRETANTILQWIQARK